MPDDSPSLSPSTPDPGPGPGTVAPRGWEPHVMTGTAPHLLQTSRLLLRPWRGAEAARLRELWSERDPRVPPHRRLDAEGHPTVEDLAEAIRTGAAGGPGLLAIERRVTSRGLCHESGVARAPTRDRGPDSSRPRRDTGVRRWRR